MTKQYFEVRVGLAPGGDIEEIRKTINRHSGAIVLDVKEVRD